MLNNNIHKSILIQILKEIYTETDIAPFLGFKGGTAVYVFYGLDRFSVDLDFDLLDDSKTHQTFESIQSIIKKHGTIKDARIKRYSIFFLLSYEKDHLNIKIEINLRNFNSQYELKNYLGIPVLVMKKDDMFAHKLVACFERMGKANRDIYDIHYFLKNQWPIHVTMVEARTGLAFSQFISQLIKQLHSTQHKNILSGIGELLNPKQKAWVKKHLIEDTVFLLKARWQS